MSGYPPPQQPPPYGMQIPMQQPVHVIIPQQLGPHSQTITCPSCQKVITTRVDQEATIKTHLFALLLCVLMCWPCACIPYCTDSCKASNHYCPNCDAFLGSHDH
ncbi:lipopolysaccharide-induced tumor necrosis factor-alpha factor homolog [Nilaparvata lugens]|uniref:lipopolysaccharide-induced tumor necrosis factor-alpha factor homolog n=1 Tax=Nilaparvata lugens TaxID=108931 RepID=UPI000B9979E6|nr:lipopolysaccharide-induced tumor necrosis factor-alpha factor homolog [Nilaparvata lugens]XP_022191464.1 lipopolysaccharide-induced tumor necrosis factor-alpha factor homolog [Nilaparvata lugens]XP_039280559.1 lipopolysaccharide-induced tumor necrosis factor-alpha factor homolog [Nilaparvata lugens]